MFVCPIIPYYCSAKHWITYRRLILIKDIFAASRSVTVTSDVFQCTSNE